jgi:hypothetical protein
MLRLLMNDEWITRIEAAVYYFKVLFRHSPGGTEETHENHSVTGEFTA